MLFTIIAIVVGILWVGYGVIRVVPSFLDYDRARYDSRYETSTDPKRAENVLALKARFESQLKQVALIHVVPIALAALIASSVVIIDAGEAGAVKRLGKVQNGSFTPGLHLIVPFIDAVEIYTTKQLVYETSDQPDKSAADYPDFTVDTMTSDGQVIKVRYTVKMSIDPAKVGYIAQNIGTEKDVVEKVVKAYSRSEGRNIPKSYRADQLYSKDVYLCQEEIAAKLKPEFAKNGIILDEFLLREIGFDGDLQKALEEKQIAKEKIVTKQAEIAQASAEASSTIVRASGDKQASIIRAEGEARAAQLIQEQLSKNPEYTKYVLAKGIADGKTGIQWSILPDSAVPFLNLQTTPSR